MGIENFRRWHWMLISLVVGAILSYANLYDITSGTRITPDERSSGQRRSIGVMELTRKLSLPKTDKGYAWLADITIYPAINGKMYVKGHELDIKGDKGVYRPFQQITEIPFRRTNGPEAPRADYTFHDYIQDQAKNNPEIQFRYAWWATANGTIALWGGGSLLLIGILWPTLLQLRYPESAADRARRKAEKARPARPHSSGGDDLSLGRPKKTAATAADQQRLTEMTAAMEKNLGSTESHATSSAPATNEPGAAVRKLDAKVVETLAPLPQQSPEEVEWGGEFYPVAHAKHKDDDPKK